MTVSEDGIAEQLQAVARSKKCSNTTRKRVRSLSREAYRSRVRNRNACHEMTTALVRRYGLLALEDLQVHDMSRSARGTMEKPGRNVAAKSGLNRSILEQTWWMIRQQLTYKAAWAGRELVVVAPGTPARPVRGAVSSRQMLGAN